MIDSGTRALTAAGVTHNAPRVGTDSELTFTVGWTAPAQVGGVDFFLYAVSANNNGMNSGDGAGSAVASYAIGCAQGITYYRDFDGDGYGVASAGTLVSCVSPPLYSALDRDCDDNVATVHPNASEVCDRLVTASGARRRSTAAAQRAALGCATTIVTTTTRRSIRVRRSCATASTTTAMGA